MFVEVWNITVWNQNIPDPNKLEQTQREAVALVGFLGTHCR